ncbi:MAG: carbohydrate porin [Methylococcales bacterium]|nr:carbohydrate porin [Methylococcales bacterium]
MQWLADKGLHDINDESWNAYGQMTFINSWKSAFPAAYTNYNDSGNSLATNQERSFTGTATLFLAARAWHGGEFYFVPEVISERALSGLKGLGSVIQNFELQKSGGQEPSYYISRGFYKQTWGFGGSKQTVASDPMQLGVTEDSRRLVLRSGEFSILDFFDKNSYSGDLRKQFNNMAFLTYAAYDFAADARGYSWGMVGELDFDQWSFKFGHMLTPKNPNQLALDVQPFKYFGQQIEIEHRHEIAGQPGAVRILGYRNVENMGKFSDAIAAFEANPAHNATTCTGFNYGSGNASAPDLCWARKTNVKMGAGLNLEQQVWDDIGLFFRGMYSDGQTEVYSYTSTDRSISLGALVKGTRWDRRKDTLGLGFAEGFLSSAHVQYLALGGIDGFIGDGKINYRPEQVVDIFYSFNVWNTVWLTADYQFINNPAYNADRGPVDIYGARIHVEF